MSLRGLRSVDSSAGERSADRSSDRLNRQLVAWANRELSELLAEFGTSPDGLSAIEADEVREHVGPNEVEHDKPMPWWWHLWVSYRNPFNLLLTLLGIVSYLTGDAQAAVVIAVMVMIATVLRFVQEGRSNREARALKERVENTAAVIRRIDEPIAALDVRSPHQIEIPIKQLVPGDIVVLSAGDMIPADCRVMAATDLFVSQSAMTGESLPVEKFPTPMVESSSAVEMDNLVFMGTNVISGAATVVVLTTGNATYFGTLATRVTRSGIDTRTRPDRTRPDRTRPDNAFHEGIDRVSRLLIRFVLVLVPAVLVINGIGKGDWPAAFLFALSVAVGLTPEMLPTIVTATLARGAIVLSRNNVIVKRLDAIQNFGAMDVLCADKTGTLTQDKIALERHIDVLGRPSDEVLEFAYLNSYHQTGLRNLLDRALLEYVELEAELQVASDYRKIDEIPFDFERRRMSVVVSEREEHHELICKGAIEELFGICTHVSVGGQILELDVAMLERVQTVTGKLNNEGMRVIAVAMKEIPPHQVVYSVADESDLTLIGFIAYLDPPKESTAPALEALAAHGVTVKVLTGDNDLVAREVCRQVGLALDGVVLGAQIDVMDDDALGAAVEVNTLFAKLSPLNKERIVHAMRDNGHVVGFMGDGINDAPALRAADIGISVQEAVDIAREAADIILLERSLMVLEQGVIEGRRTFTNMLKYIRMTTSSNFGNVFSILIASIFLPFLPMLPLQLLTQNLLYDVSQIAIPFDNVDDEVVRLPLKWKPDDIGRFMVFFGPLSSIFDLVAFAVMWYVFEANTVGRQSLFQSGWFILGLVSQTLIVHLIRTPRVPFYQSRPAGLLLGTTLVIVAVAIFLPMGPLADFFDFEPLPGSYFVWLSAILLGYGLLTALMKREYIKRFGWQ